MNYGANSRDFQQSNRFCIVFRTNIGSGSAHRSGVGGGQPLQPRSQQPESRYGTSRNRPVQDIDSLLDELLGIGGGGGGGSGGGTGGAARPAGERLRHRSTEPAEHTDRNFAYQLPVHHQPQQPAHQQHHVLLKQQQPFQQQQQQHHHQQQLFSSSSSTAGGGYRYQSSTGGGGGGGGGRGDGFQTERERQLATELRRTQKKLKKLRKAASDCGYDLDEELQSCFQLNQPETPT